MPPRPGPRPPASTRSGRGSIEGTGWYEHPAKTEGPVDLGGSQLGPEDNEVVHFTIDLL